MRLGIALAAALLLRTVLAGATEARLLDDFADPQAWTAVASDQVEAKLRPLRDGAANALCLDFDFHGVSGYAAMRRTLPVDYPDNYEFSFRVRGEAPDNALQFKLADASGDNVWWVNRPDFSVPREWREQRYKRRQVDFAWGPIKDKTLRHSDSVEFTLYAGNGGRGSVCFDRLTLRELPPAPTSWPAPHARASSERADAPAANAVDGDANTRWRSRRGGEQTLTLDFGAPREFGGLLLRWADGAHASRYDVDLSDDGEHWRTVRRVTQGNGGIDPLHLPESESRYLRLSLHDGPRKDYAIEEIEIKDLAFGASANSFFAELAQAAPRGRYPRGFYDEQTYWTVVGVDGGHQTGLFSEDGALEVARGGFSIEPFLLETEGRQRRLLSWADVDLSHSLQDGYLPIPRVHWRRDDLALDVETFATSTAGPAAPEAQDSNLYASYTLKNEGAKPRSLTLALALRPFQVNPSVQFLNTPGGISPIHELAWRKPSDDGREAVYVDGKPRVYPLDHADGFRASAFDAGMATDRLADGTLPDASAVRDDTGFASGVLLYRVDLPPNAARTIVLQMPLDGAAPADQFQVFAETWYRLLRDKTAQEWREKLDQVRLRVPAAGRALADTLRTALAHILINRDGAAIRPGTRAYARSWIRDGAMTSEALLRLGRDDVARDYLAWYAPYQFKNGKVPCCVDRRGSDPVPENDSHGELIHLVAEVWRHGGDRALLETMWPHVDAAARYMDELRASERTPANRSGERKALYGLMPASISHEGYSAKPMHSYWDDFWALTGYKDAVDLATALGKDDAARRLARSRDQFRTDLYASIRAAVAAHRIDYLPGAAELGDFDATSTTIALSPGGEQARLPQDLLRNTFERYWKQFAERRDSTAWKDYTPYEWRTVGTFVRLRWRERAHEAIEWFLHDRRPAEWNQWAEVVGRLPRESRFIGDMPHGWVASDFIRSALDLFAYEREDDRALVLAAGVPDAWLSGDGVAIENLRTPYGKLSYSLQREGDALHLRIADTGAKPPGGFVFAAPKEYVGGEAWLGREALKWRSGELVVRDLPADVILQPAAQR
ncbi:discoidin domain-containing protein [Dokdonella sp.]|uniref:discoidin domain-containing protein n=1 Tax=Dokdonella sp. TaxID=2291710 RepID=UPI001B26EEF3|nr:discoidin domain-containing protein [Dokdonella sp.]MBO9662802.1 discoidin domain-containing protein [Dokdonella sp.]